MKMYISVLIFKYFESVKKSKNAFLMRNKGLNELFLNKLNLKTA